MTIKNQEIALEVLKVALDLAQNTTVNTGMGGDKTQAIKYKIQYTVTSLKQLLEEIELEEKKK